MATDRPLSCILFLLKISIFHTICSDYGFPSFISSHVLPTFLPFQVHDFFSASLENKEENK